MLQTTQSWRHMSRCSARRRGRGTMGGSSVDTKSFPSVDCGTFLQLAALTESQKQQSTRPVYPHTWRQYNTLSSGRACHPHASSESPVQFCGCCCAASRLLRLCLSACVARQAAPLNAYCRAPHPRVHCITLRRLRLRGATLLIRRSIQIEYCDTAFN